MRTENGRGKQRERNRKIPIDERRRGKETRSKGRARRGQAGRWEDEGKKNRRRMNYRGASKDETYGSKNRNQSHWLKAAWRREKREREREKEEYPGPLTAELPGSPMSTCLPLPPDFPVFLSLIFIPSLPSFSLFLSSSVRFFVVVVVFFFLLFLLYLLLLADLPSSSRRARRASSCYHLYPWPVHHTDICGAESFHANSSENAFFVERRRRRCRTRSPR